MKSVDIEFRLVQQKTKSYRVMFESEKSLGFFYAASRDRRDTDTVVGIETSLEQRNCIGDFSSTVKRVPTTDGTIVRVLDGYCKSETSGLLITTTTVITQWPRRQTTSVLKKMSASKAGRKIQERVNKGKSLTL